ncbi:YwqJ-related putative deaminase [Streptomyces sp. NBC_01217]|uniref:YwqJ-related putative deaminase n=1 Tax=Streptomyces sp. NBC_01217 TaxID=2903779 RepID=UPI002E0D317E|nr:YwqJ-related putative deaminase [Streptomyces sp. NBC_01217]
MSEQFPAVASSLLISGRVVSHTSLIGEGTAELHPAIRAFVNSLPANVRKSFTGSCAETALVSDQLWALDSARNDGRTTTLGEATPHFTESAIVSKMIRGHGHPDHGKVTAPCSVCQLLLQELGVRVIS